MAALDHIAVAAATLEEAAVHVAACLGQPPGAGGHHDLMGTHNRLMALGTGEYLEAIAVDPDAPAPGRPRWFDLDRFRGQARLSNWVVRTEDIEAVAAGRPDLGEVLALKRGDLRWRMTVPADGCLPFDGCFPAFIQWDGAMPSLPDMGIVLTRLELHHPKADALRAALDGLISDGRVVITDGDPALVAAFDTPDGPRILR